MTILRDVNLLNDCVAGLTKVFITSPATVFELEELRARRIPYVAVLLQRVRIFYTYSFNTHAIQMARGMIARRQYARMRAAKAIMDRWRRYKIRSYIVNLCDHMRGVGKLPDLGKSVQWPRPPAVLKPFVLRLHQMYGHWRACVILSRIPSHLRLALPQKLAAYEAFNRRREEWGYDRVWIGDHLLESSEHYVDDAKGVYDNAIVRLRESHKFNRVLFSSFIHKINRFVPCAISGMIIGNN